MARFGPPGGGRVPEKSERHTKDDGIWSFHVDDCKILW